ncbi:MAG: hypothetical protein U5K30_01990 [Acidimicrobiales bacterium]|nr:hypothetical protein [Acidimicrobiales bacterium]
MALPDFIIGGASKSGTTSLYRWIGSHPDVEVPASKELRFFDGYNADKGWDWYVDQIPRSRRDGRGIAPLPDRRRSRGDRRPAA